MSRTFFRALIALMLLAYLLLPASAQAHETITFGNYAVVYGWQNEPPVAGEPNAITLTITETAAHSEGEEQAEGEPGALSIVSPSDGAEVQGDSVEVTVGLEGEPAGGQHWHLYVDGQLATMQELDQPAFTVTGLSNGEHLLEAKLADTDHAESGIAATAKIMVSGSTAQGTPAPATAEGGDHEHGTPSSVDVSGLTVAVSYGGQNRVLALEPVFGGEPGEYLARLTPSRAGQYTVVLNGQLGDTPVDAAIEPEEVMGAEVLAFPAVEAGAGLDERLAAIESQANTAQIIAIIGLVTGLLGLAAGGLGLLRRGR